MGNLPFNIKSSFSERMVLLIFFFCISYLGSQIKDHFGDGSSWGVRLNYSQEKERLLGTGGALKKTETLLEDEFLIIYGDSYLLLDYQEIALCFHNFNKGGLMVVYKNYNQFDKSNLIVKNGLVRLYDKKGVNPEMVYIDEGISILRKETLHSFPSGKPFALDKIFQRLIGEKELLAFQVIGNIREWLDFHNFAGIEIIVGSIRSRENVELWSQSGAHILTIPPQIISQCLVSARTKETVAQFLGDAQKALEGLEDRSI